MPFTPDADKLADGQTVALPAKLPAWLTAVANICPEMLRIPSSRGIRYETQQPVQCLSVRVFKAVKSSTGCSYFQLFRSLLLEQIVFNYNVISLN